MSEAVPVVRFTDAQRRHLELMLSRLVRETRERLDHWDPWVFLASLAVGIIALVVVSLLTAPEPEARREAFFEKLDTSTDDGAPTGPREAAEAGQQLLLVNLLHPRRGAAGVGFFQAYREDLRGFAVGWAIAAVLVLGTALLLRV